MTGYIKAFKPELKIKDYELYRGVYCSECRVLGKLYTPIARMLLSYDFTFLSIVRLALQEQCGKFEEGRCCANPAKKCLKCTEDAELERSADVVIIVSYYKLLDDIADGGFFKRLACRLIKPALSLMHKKAAKRQEMTAASRPKFMFFGAVLCLWFSLPLLVTFKCTKEPSSLGMKLPPFNATMLFEEYKQVFRNKAFRRYFVLSSMYTMAKGFYANSNQYFIKYSAQRFGYFNTLQTIAGAAEASGFPVNYLLTMKKGKQLCGKLLTPLMAAGLIINLFIGKSTPLWVVIVSIVLYNFGFSGPGFTATNIQPDVTDVDEMITGRRREGVISTFNTLIKKTINGLMSAFTGFILKGFGFRTGAEGANALEQTAKGIFGLKVTYCILPLIFVGLVYVCVFTYKMTREDHKMITEAIKEKKETGKCSLTPEQMKRCEEIAGQSFGDMWIGKPSAETLVTELD